MGDGAARRGSVPPGRSRGRLRFTAWVEEGPRYAYVVIETDATLTPWTRRAVRLADHIVLVADATAAPEPGPMEVALLVDAYGLLEFKKIHAIAQVGYRYALEAAARWSGPRGAV